VLWFIQGALQGASARYASRKFVGHGERKSFAQEENSWAR
jgi:hypothetical protein